MFAPLLALALLAGCAQQAAQNPEAAPLSTEAPVETVQVPSPAVSQAASATVKDASSESKAKLSLATLKVEGMDCGGCAAEVRRVLTKAGAADALVSAADGLAKVHFDPKKTDPAKLVAAFEGQDQFRVSVSPQ